MDSRRSRAEKSLVGGGTVPQPGIPNTQHLSTRNDVFLVKEACSRPLVFLPRLFFFPSRCLLGGSGVDCLEPLGMTEAHG